MAKVEYKEGTDYKEIKARLQLQLDHLGYGKRFSVNFSTTFPGKEKGNPYVEYTVYDNATGKSYDSIAEATKAIKSEKRSLTSRTRNVGPNTSPVSVSKRGSGLGVRQIGSAAGYTNVSSNEYGLQLNKAREQVRAFNAKYGKTLITIKNDPNYQTIFFVVNRKLYYDYSEAASAAVPRKGSYTARHFDDLDAKDYICHALFDGYFTSMTVDEFRNFFNS